VGGYFPGPAAFAAVVGVKFGGYVLAGVALKRLEPAITASSVKIAAARTGLGILFGPPVTFAIFLALQPLKLADNTSSYVFYPFLYALRVLIWAWVILLFVKNLNLPKSTLWKYATAAALWSCLLDLPAYGLAIISPGQIPIC
jgi:hypothetical protein